MILGEKRDHSDTAKDINQKLLQYLISSSEKYYRLPRKLVWAKPCILRGENIYEADHCSIELNFTIFYYFFPHPSRP